MTIHIFYEEDRLGSDNTLGQGYTDQWGKWHQDNNDSVVSNQLTFKFAGYTEYSSDAEKSSNSSYNQYKYQIVGKDGQQGGFTGWTTVDYGGKDVRVHNNGDGTFTVDKTQFASLGLGEHGGFNFQYYVYNLDGTARDNEAGEHGHPEWDGHHYGYAWINIHGLNNSAPIVKDVFRQEDEDGLAGNTWNDTLVNNEIKFKLDVTDPDGDQLYYGVPASVTVNGRTFTLINNKDGTVSLDKSQFQYLKAGESVALTFTYGADDGQNPASVASATFVIHGLNDAVVDYNEFKEINEGESVDVPLLLNAVDPDGDVVTLKSINSIKIGDGSIITDPILIAKYVTVLPNGTIRFNSEGIEVKPGAQTLVSIGYTVQDGKGSTDDSVADICIKGTNDAITDGDEARTIKEGESVSINLLANAVDPDGTPALKSVDKIFVNGVEVAKPAYLTINTNGTITVDSTHPSFPALPAGKNLVIDVRYTVTDNQGSEDASKAVITVQGQNGTLTDGDEGVTNGIYVDENSSVNVNLTANAVDSDGDNVDIKSINSIKIGNVTYTGADIAKYVTVIDGDNIRFTAAGIELAKGATLPVEIKYTVTDNKGATDDSTAFITIRGVNDPLTDADEGPIALNEGQSYIIDLTKNSVDPDGDNVTISKINSITFNGVTYTGADIAKYVTLGADGKTITFKTDNINLPAGVVKDAVVSYTVTDGNGSFDDSIATFRVTGVNNAVIDDNEFKIINEGESVDVPLLLNAVDPDGDVVTLKSINSIKIGDGSVITDPILITKYVTVLPNGTIRFNSEGIEVKPGTELLVKIGYTVQDGKGSTDDSVADICIKGTNDAITDGDEARTIKEGESVSINLLANAVDPDGTPALKSVDRVTLNGNVLTPTDIAKYISVVGGVLTLNSAGLSLAKGQNAVFVIDYTVTDNQGSTDISKAIITVEGQNSDWLKDGDEGPIAVSEGSSVSIDLTKNAEDPDGDNITVSQIKSVTFNGVTYTGADIAKYVTLGADGKTITFKTDNINLPAGVVKDAVVSYTVTDGNGSFDDSIATFRVTGTNDALTDGDEGPIAVNEGSSASVNLTANSIDTDGDNVTISQIKSITFDGKTYTGADIAKYVTVAADGKTITFKTDNINLPAGIVKDAVVSYTVTDGNGSFDDSIATFRVTGVNNAVIDDNEFKIINEGESVDVPLLLNSFDPDGDVVTLKSINSIKIGDGSVITDSILIAKYVTVLPNGTIRFNSEGIEVKPGTELLVKIGYTVQDGKGSTDDSVADICIKGTNDAITDGDEARTIKEGESVSINLLANAVDPDGTPALKSVDKIFVNGVEVAKPAYLTINTNGTITVDSTHPSFPALPAGKNLVIDVRYTVTDNQGSEDASKAVITVQGQNGGLTDGNEGPIAVNEGGSVETNLTSNSIDTDGDNVTISKINSITFNGATYTGADIAKFVTVAADGKTIIFKADVELPAGVTKDAVVSYTVTDGKGSFDDSTATYTITGVNDILTDGDEVRSIKEGESVDINLIDNAVDPDGDAVSIHSIDKMFINGVEVSPQYTWLPGGVIRFNSNILPELKPGEVATVVYEYRVTDGKGGFDTSKATITVTGVNDAITDGDEARTINEGESVSINLLANAVDPDGTPALKSVDKIFVNGVEVAKPAYLTINTNGTITVDSTHPSFPALPAGKNLVIDVRYTVTDNQGSEDASKAVITVQGQNGGLTDGDEGVVAPIYVDEGSSVDVNLTANAVDSDGDNVDIKSINSIKIGATTYTGADIAKYVTIVNGDVVKFTPAGVELAKGALVPVEIKYTVTDNNGSTDDSTAYINIKGINDNPDAKNIIREEDEDNVDDTTNPYNQWNDSTSNTEIRFALEATDVDGDKLTYSTPTSVTIGGKTYSLSNNNDGTVSLDKSQFQFLKAGESVTLTFNYTVTDGQGGSDTAQATFIIHGKNDALTDGDEGPIAVNEGSSASVNLTANSIDTDSDNVTISQIKSITFDGKTYTGADIAKYVTVAADGKTITFKTDNINLPAGVVKDAVVSYTVTDGNGSFDDSIATFRVTGTNDALTDGDEGPIAVNEGSSASVNLTANSIDTDGDNVTISQIKSITFDGKTYTGADIAKYVTVAADGKTITFKTDNINLPAGIVKDAVVSYTVTDGNGSFDDSIATFRVTGVNNAVIDGDEGVVAPIYVDEGSSVDVNLTANAVDSDGDNVDIKSINSIKIGATTYTGADIAKYVTIVNGDVVKFTPAGVELAKGALVPVEIKYTVTDNNGSTDDSTAYINIKGINDNPDAKNIIREEDEDNVDDTTNPYNQWNDSTSNTEIRFALEATDVDGDKLTYSTPTSVTIGGKTYSLSNNNDGTVSLDKSQFQFLKAGESVTLTFNYTVTDGQGGSDTAQATFIIHGKNDALTDGDEARTINEGETATINLLANANDPDGDTPALKSIDKVTLNGTTLSPADIAKYITVANGVVVLTTAGMGLAKGENAVFVIDYTVTDNKGSEDPSKAVITVVGQNGNLTDGDEGPFDVNEGANRVVDLLANAVDSDGDVVTLKSIDSVTVDGVALSPADIAKYIKVVGGQLTFTADFNLTVGQTKAVVVNYTVTDNKGAEDASKVSFNVIGQNGTLTDADEGKPTPITVEEDSSVNINLTANAVDSDGDNVDIKSINSIKIGATTYTNPAEIAKYVTIVNGDVVKFTPAGVELAKDAIIPVEIRYTVTDNNGSTDDSTAYINIKGINDNPDAKNIIREEDEDVLTQANWNDSKSATKITFALEATDVDGDSPLTYSVPTSVTIGGKTYSLTNNNDGTVSLDKSQFQYLNNGESVTLVFNYTVTDGKGGSDTAQATFIIHGNEVTDGDETASVLEGKSVVIDLDNNFSDPDGDVAASYKIDKLEIGGVVINPADYEKYLKILPNNQLVFDASDVDAPDFGQTLPVKIYYTITDGKGESNASIATITVNDDNIPSDPVIDLQNFNTSVITRPADADDAIVDKSKTSSNSTISFGDDVKNPVTGNDDIVSGDVGNFTLTVTAGDARAFARPASEGGSEIAEAVTDAKFTNNEIDFGEDIIKSGGGNDTLYGDAVQVIINGNQGDMTASVDPNCFDPYAYASANVKVTNNDFNFGSDELDGGNGNDVIIGDAKVLDINYTNGVTNGSVVVDDDNWISGNTFNFGDDVITGGRGDDTLTGDILRIEVDGTVYNFANGGAPANFATSNIATTNTFNFGADTFVFNTSETFGNDKITDFGTGADKLNFTGVKDTNGNSISNIADLLAISKIVNDGNGNIKLVVDGNIDGNFESSITLLGISFEAGKVEITDYINSSDIIIEA